MSARRPSGARTGRPAVTSRAQILGAARALIDRDGWDKLTLRGLAAELGIGTTTLYHHVRNREDLLVQLITDHVVSQPRVELPDDPRERIIAAATVMHDGFAAVPWAAEVLTVDGFVGRLGDPALGLVEAIVGGAVECGCTHEQSVAVFRSLWYYTVGEILVRAATAGNHAVDRAKLLDHDVRFARRDAERLPHLAAIGERWPELAARDTYAEGLRAFVDGLLTASRTPRPER